MSQLNCRIAEIFVTTTKEDHYKDDIICTITGRLIGALSSGKGILCSLQKVHGQKAGQLITYKVKIDTDLSFVFRLPPIPESLDVIAVISSPEQLFPPLEIDYLTMKTIGESHLKPSSDNLENGLDSNLVKTALAIDDPGLMDARAAIKDEDELIPATFPKLGASRLAQERQPRHMEVQVPAKTVKRRFDQPVVATHQRRMPESPEENDTPWAEESDIIEETQTKTGEKMAQNQTEPLVKYLLIALIVMQGLSLFMVFFNRATPPQPVREAKVSASATAPDATQEPGSTTIIMKGNEGLKCKFVSEGTPEGVNEADESRYEPGKKEWMNLILCDDGRTFLTQLDRIPDTGFPENVLFPVPSE